MRIKELIKSLGTDINYSNLPDFEVSGISCNSKNIKENFVFVAVKGTRENGDKFIPEAIERGARAVLVQGSHTSRNGIPTMSGKGEKSSKRVALIEVKDTRKALAKLAAEFYGHPSLKIKVVGITGTNGKTTVSYLIEALLKEAGALPSVIGTINYRFKDRVIPPKNTTPGPIEIESMLAEMLKEGIDYTIMEVSSHALDQARTCGINFHSAIFTNLTLDHLDYHKTLENYFKVKSRLFKNINPKSFVVVNNDDRFGERIKRKTRAKIITYGIENNADIRAEDIRFDCQHTAFRLISPRGEIDFTSRLIGRYNVYNILAAVAWAEEENIDSRVIKSAIERFFQVPGRLERIDFQGDFSVFVDYAHTEDALKNVIQTLRNLSKGRLIVVFGCGGERDKTKRPKMGRVVSELSDYAIITNDNPRSENPQDIINDIKRGVRKTNLCVIPERAEAIKKSLSLAKTGDIVLVAGKGHEDYQLIKDRVIHFDDREVIRECLKSMNY